MSLLSSLFPKVHCIKPYPNRIFKLRGERCKLNSKYQQLNRIVNMVDFVDLFSIGKESWIGMAGRKHSTVVVVVGLTVVYPNVSVNYISHHVNSGKQLVNPCGPPS